MRGKVKAQTTKPKLKALGSRAVACKGWRWMPGMLAWFQYTPGVGPESWVLLTGETRPFVGYPDCAPRQYAGVEYGKSSALEWWNVTMPQCIPDLSHPATLGGLLALVREAWEDSGAFVRPQRGGRTWVFRKDGECPYLVGFGEAEALVVALERAP